MKFMMWIIIHIIYNYKLIRRYDLKFKKNGLQTVPTFIINKSMLNHLTNRTPMMSRNSYFRHFSFIS